MELPGTVALVTGGAKRVGRAIVLELARAGCHVAIHHRRAPPKAGRASPDADRLAEEVAALGSRAVIVVGEMTEPADWPRMIDHTLEGFGRLDILINNASIFLTERPDSLDGFDAEQWERLLRANLVAPMGLSHFAREHLAAHGNGCVVNLCDISALRPWPDHLAYCASKAALECLTKGLALAMAPTVRVNGVAPGIAVFPAAYSEELRHQLIDKVPLRRTGTPEEVAGVVRFLVESGEYITGQIIPIDGGRSLV